MQAGWTVTETSLGRAVMCWCKRLSVRGLQPSSHTPEVPLWRFTRLSRDRQPSGTFFAAMSRCEAASLGARELPQFGREAERFLYSVTLTNSIIGVVALAERAARSSLRTPKPAQKSCEHLRKCRVFVLAQLCSHGQNIQPLRAWSGLEDPLQWSIILVIHLTLVARRGACGGRLG
jgi:hypothetical protein